MVIINKKKVWFFSIFGLILLILIGCYLLLSCREYCVSFVKINYLAIMSKLFVYTKKISLIVLLFISFKTVQIVFIERLLRRFMQKIGIFERYNRLKKLISFGMWAIYTLIVLSVLIGNITALLASLGLIGFGLTFALQKPILNFVGWLTIIINNIYSEEDRIRIGGVVGDVKEIQIMNTILDGLLENSDVRSIKTISFPNELVLTSEVVNFTKESNYIVNELSISITYESNYHKAIKLLRGIITNQVRVNKQKYIKRIAKQKKNVNQFLNKWIMSGKISEAKESEENQKIENLKKENKQLNQELENLEEEFVPRIRVEMLDSSIQLIAQFKCPYDEIKKNRTEINVAFLDAIKKEQDIEIAYPHMQLVTRGDKNQNIK